MIYRDKNKIEPPSYDFSDDVLYLPKSTFIPMDKVN